MNFKDTLKRALLDYPSVHPNIGSACHHLFFVIGNGYDWVDGELVTDTSRDPERGQKWFERCIAEAKESSMSDALVLHYEQQLHAYQFTKANIDRIIEHGSWKYTGSLYPWSDLAEIMNVPADVKEDWLRAAYKHAQDIQQHINQRKSRGLTDDEKVYDEKLPALLEKLDDMLIERGLHSTREQRAKTLAQIIAMLDPAA